VEPTIGKLSSTSSSAAAYQVGVTGEVAFDDGF
jgi:hypothetical protein